MLRCEWCCRRCADFRLFQVGALKAFLDEAEMPLNHIKPHGMWVSDTLVSLY